MAEKDVEALLAQTDDGERPRLAFHTMYLLAAGLTAKGAAVLITDRALYASKDRMFGKPRVDLWVPMETVSRVTSEIFTGSVIPSWIVTWSAEDVGSLLVNTNDGASTVVNTIRDNVAALRDPDYATLLRGMDQANELPPGNLGSQLTLDQLISEARWLRKMLNQRSYEEAWRRRVELGYVDVDELPAGDRFWIDAAPAIAALKLGWKDHPLVAMCCGMAEANAKKSDREQRDAVNEMAELYNR